MTNTTLNTTALEIIATFSKANKVSRAKVTELAEQLVATMPVMVSTNRSSAGRKASETVLALRKMMEEQKDIVVNMTAKEVASKFGVEPIEANNTLRFLEKTGLFVRTGLKDKEAGVRGKREVLWSVASN
jgi:DNA-binding MarR family transcriptional regulator